MVGYREDPRTRSLETAMNRISFDMMLDGSNLGPIIAVRTLFRGRKDLLPSSFVLPQSRSDLPNRAVSSPAERIPCSLDREGEVPLVEIGRQRFARRQMPQSKTIVGPTSSIGRLFAPPLDQRSGTHPIQHSRFAGAPSATGIRSSLRSCGSSTARRHPVSICIWFWTTMRPTTIPRSAPGWPSGPGSTSTSPRPPPSGSTRWSAGSPSSASAPSSAARSTASPTSSEPSKDSSTTTPRPRPRSSGSRPPIQSSRKSKDYLCVFGGHNTN